MALVVQVVVALAIAPPRAGGDPFGMRCRPSPPRVPLATSMSWKYDKTQVERDVMLKWYSVGRRKVHRSQVENGTLQVDILDTSVMWH